MANVHFNCRNAWKKYTMHTSKLDSQLHVAGSDQNTGWYFICITWLGTSVEGISYYFVKNLFSQVLGREQTRNIAGLFILVIPSGIHSAWSTANV